MDYNTLEQQLLEIGDELTLSCKGRCHSYAMDKANKTVVFNYTEDSEEPEISMTFREITLLWGIPGRELYRHAIDWNEKEREKGV